MENQDYTENRVIIRSYNKAWNIENRVYALGNITLPVPIAPREVLYFAVSALIIYLLSQIIPPFKLIPVIIRYAILPFFLTKFFQNKKLDGKNPFKFFSALIKYIINKRLFIERFTEHKPNDNTIIKLNWWCSYVKMSD